MNSVLSQKLTQIQELSDSDAAAVIAFAELLAAKQQMTNTSDAEKFGELSSKLGNVIQELDDQLWSAQFEHKAYREKFQHWLDAVDAEIEAGTDTHLPDLK